ncbi:MAG TPA: MFS transporter [Polyangiaceae bacterium]|nr:MFS transporter [Polyangiaceae bacterium]
MLVALFILTFLESIAATLLQRGVYFYTHENLGFSQNQNLWVAFGFGATYIIGAFTSHGLCTRFGERRLLLGCIAALLVIHSLLALFPAAWCLVVGVFATAIVQGLKWPVVESYVSAGRAPKQLLPILSRYNVTWATAGFVAIGVTGLIVGTHVPSLFFWLPAALNVGAIALALRLPEKPLHLDHSHPERPAAGELQRMRALLGSARWSMTGSYALLYVLAPLMPSVLAQLALPVTLATPVASILDAVRVVTFGALGAFAGWHGKRAPMWLTLAALPTAFLLILLGNSLPLVIAGEVVFGIAAGFSYTSALYYALVSENASVDAGGAHESLIGIGIGLGPLSGLAGQLLVGSQLPFARAGSGLQPFVALAITTTPIIAICVLGALRSLFRLPARPA